MRGQLTSNVRHRQQMPLRLGAGSAAIAVNLNSHANFCALRETTARTLKASDGNAAASYQNRKSNGARANWRTAAASSRLARRSARVLRHSRHQQRVRPMNSRQPRCGLHQENPVRCGSNRVEFKQMPANLTPPACYVRRSQGMPNLALELTHYSLAPGPRAAFVHVAPHGPGATL